MRFYLPQPQTTSNILNFHIAALLLFITGCSSLSQHTPVTPTDHITATSYYDLEAEYYNNPENDPELCLALSGGGIRSAAFNIGILSYLYENDLLKEFDIVSSVSGGSYASTAFINYISSKKNTLEHNENATSELIRQIISNNSFITPVKGIYIAGFSITANPLKVTATQTIKGVASKTKYIPDPGNFPYSRAISETFYSGEKDILLDAFLSITSTDQRAYPYPIILTTARSGTQNKCIQPDERTLLGETGSLHKSIFEFTPLGFGSCAYGYWRDYPSTLTMSRLTALSGSAPDHPELPFCNLMNIFGLIVSGSLDLQDPASSERLKLYLTDGGHAENLAIYPLARRHCSKIVAVDAEYDPWLIFDGYQRLKESLEISGAEISIPDLENIYEGRYNMCKRNKICYVEPKHETDVRSDKVTYPVFRGHINDSKILYIKLAYDKAEARNGLYGQDVMNCVFDDNEGKCNGDNPLNTFPQYPTTKQHLSKEKLSALISLGRSIASKSLREFIEGNGDE